MSHKTKIFITGATGYIGGSVLERLLNHPEIGDFTITAIVRNAGKATKFRAFGIDAVVGSFNDVRLLEDLTAAADIVIDTVDADNLDAAKVMLRGSKRKFQETGKPPVFIHTSGTGLLAEDTDSLQAPEIIWDDANPDQLEKLPLAAQHRDVDLEFIRADQEGYVRAYIVAPSTIYGIASGKLVDAGLANDHSIQVPLLITTALERGRAGVIGKGSGIWLDVHIDDLADLYLIIFNTAKRSPEGIGHGREGYYFGENGEHNWYDASKEVGRVLVNLGKILDAEPTPFTQDEIDTYFNGSKLLFGTNSRGRASRSRSIGWMPEKTAKDFLASIQREADKVIERQ